MTTLDYFYQICKIPRESGNEEGMRQYILSWAKENNLKAARDKAGNIVVKKEASKGYEDRPSVALQGHMDMVCVKTADSKHDFTKDPIEVYQDGDWLKAKDTSLGGDNGIAVAMVMALFTDDTAKHGPLEGIFTFSEETGMDGAFGLDPSLIDSRMLVNLDSEEEGIIYIGCAGGIEVFADKKVSYENVPEDWETVQIEVGGLKGGHSGGEIHLQRLNAISALARALHTINEDGTPYMISSFNGGTKRNVIPSAAKCVVSFPEATKKQTMQRVIASLNASKEEYKYEEPGFFENHHCTKCGVGLEKAKKAVSTKDSVAIVDSLFASPHGVYSMSKAIEGIVETSNNLAIANLKDEVFHVEVSVRSSYESAKNCLANRIALIFSAFGFNSKIGLSYPGWTPDPNSKLAQFCKKAYMDITGKEPILTAIHAGLECGVINSLIPGMDSISIGPDMKDIHSVNEKLSLSSTLRSYEFVKTMLSLIK